MDEATAEAIRRAGRSAADRELEGNDGASERRRSAFRIFRPTQPGVRPITTEDIRQDEVEEDPRLSAGDG